MVQVAFCLALRRMLREPGSSLVCRRRRRCCTRPARILLVAVDVLVNIARYRVHKDKRTTAAQQTRSSYLCCGLRSRRRNQWSEPCGVSSLGKSTSSDVLSVLSLWVMACNWRTSREGLLSVKVMALGAVNMAFSVFASAEATSRASREARLPGSFIVMAVVEEAGREGGSEGAVRSGFAALELNTGRCVNAGGHVTWDMAYERCCCCRSSISGSMYLVPDVNTGTIAITSSSRPQSRSLSQLLSTGRRAAIRCHGHAKQLAHAHRPPRATGIPERLS